MTDAIIDSHQQPRVLAPTVRRQHIVAARTPDGITAAVGDATHHHPAFPLPERDGHHFRLHPETAVVEARAPTGRDGLLLGLVRSSSSLGPTLVGLDLDGGTFERLYSPAPVHVVFAASGSRANPRRANSWLPGAVGNTLTDFHAFTRHGGLFVAADHASGHFYTLRYPQLEVTSLGFIRAGIDALCSFTDADGTRHLWGADGATGALHEIDLAAATAQKLRVTAFLYALGIRSMLTHRLANGSLFVVTLTRGLNGTVLVSDGSSWRRHQLSKQGTLAFLTTHNDRIICITQNDAGDIVAETVRLEAGVWNIYSVATTAETVTLTGGPAIPLERVSQFAPEAALGPWQPAATLPPSEPF